MQECYRVHLSCQVWSSVLDINSLEDCYFIGYLDWIHCFTRTSQGNHFCAIHFRKFKNQGKFLNHCAYILITPETSLYPKISIPQVIQNILICTLNISTNTVKIGWSGSFLWNFLVIMLAFWQKSNQEIHNRHSNKLILEKKLFKSLNIEHI